MAEGDHLRTTAWTDVNPDLESGLASACQRYGLEVANLAFQNPSNGWRVIALTGTKVQVRAVLVGYFGYTPAELERWVPQVE